jgi:AcrR family transcriptional regulator
VSHDEHAEPSADGSATSDDEIGTTRAVIEQSLERGATIQIDEEAARIIDAAWVILARSGWAGLKVDLVLAEAGLSTRSFYRHFKSKSELLLVLLEGESRRASERLEQAARCQDGPDAQVAAWIENFVGLSRNPQTAGRTKLFLTMWAILDHEFPREVGMCAEILLAPLVRIIEEGRDEGAFPNSEPREDAAAVFALAVGRLMEMKRTKGRNLEGAIEQSTQFSLRALHS